MKIGGLQKMTLLDYPGKVACTVFLSGCNLRCPFCHNAGLVLPEQMAPDMTQEELLQFLTQRTGKLDGVCITGGEPTIHPDLPQLIREIRNLGYSVKLDTNGTNPQMLEALIDAGELDYVAMDVKNCPQRYAETCGGAQVLDAVEASKDLLLRGRVDYEFRTTVCKPFHDPQAIRSLAQWIAGAKRYFLQTFVDSGNLVGEGAVPFTPQEMEALTYVARVFVPDTQVRGS